MAAVIGAFIVFAVLLFSLAPIIYVADSPLFSTASFYLSSAQPPGYPLFITLGKLFTFLPAGSIAFRVGLLSAVSACLAWFMLFKLIKRTTNNGALAFSFAFLPVFLPLVYQQSVEQKGVYALNSFFGLLILYLGIRAWEEDDARLLYVIAFLFGLGSGNHHTLALFLFPALVPFWAVAIGKKRWGAILWSALFFAGGFLIYLHLYLRSLVLAQKAFIYSIATDLSGFLYIFFRKVYHVGTLGGLKRLGASHAVSHYFTGAGNVVRYVIASQYGAVMTVIFFLSLILLVLSHEKKILKAYILLAVFPWIVLLPEMAFGGVPGEAGIQMVGQYFMPVFFLIALAMALAANRAWLYLKGKKLKTLKVAQIFLLIPLVYLPGTLKYSLNDSYIAYDHARDSLSVLPAGGVLLLYGDNPTFEDYYIHWVERYREDILAFSKIPDREAYAIAGRSDYLLNKNLFNAYMESTGDDDLKMNFSKLDVLSRNGRLFAVHADAMTQILKTRYKTSFSGPLDYMVLERGAPPGPANEFLLENYPKLNFERAEAEYSGDSFVEELKNLYGFSLLSVAVKSENQAGSNRLYRAALKLVNPESFLPYYTVPMVKRGQETNALAFLHQMEGSLPDTSMASIAHVMEYIVLSKTGAPADQSAVAAKYEYLKEHGLLIYLPDVSAICRRMGLPAKAIPSS
ncbi:MAG: DUF2723 domain-containing protein [Nitrospiraceae bacterium]|nr:DUF2723 domain-containing protein [Nitrospiraceae bacterium]